MEKVLFQILPEIKKLKLSKSSIWPSSNKNKNSSKEEEKTKCSTLIQFNGKVSGEKSNANIRVTKQELLVNF